MARLILLLFITLPITEIAIFIEAGELIGFWATLLVVVFTAIIGTAMLRQQGMSVLRSAEAALQRNELPMEEVATGICLLVAGALLLTPGFLTDLVGFALLISPFRHFLGMLVFRHYVNSGRTSIWMGGAKRAGHSSSNDPSGDAGSAPVIDGEYHEVNNSSPDKNKSTHSIQDARR
ncbi:MAG: exclusion suppressor FxsA [Rhodospirillaceae bacterium]|mgnify:CR=1 FL=1|nr:exclusion suppressor FxsA [Rhodospirillaceae bacterium]